MKVLVVGSGGREHALVWKIAQSPLVKKIYCAPGNAGISTLAECVNISAEDIKELCAFAQNKKIDLTVVGPETALTLGIVDIFSAKKLSIFGPGKEAAAIEGSKVFAKKLMDKYHIPTGKYEVFTSTDKAMAYLKKAAFPLVIKADGLAAGKGVIVAQSYEEGAAAVDLIMQKKAFGEAGKKIIIEEFLEGEEVSFMAVTDGKTVLPLATSQDHKAIFDGDRGPNTGGMGAYSPAPLVTPQLYRQIMKEIMQPTIKALVAEGQPYRGVLYAGLIIKEGKAKVLEFNCRFGDPEAQPILVRMKGDLVRIMQAAIDGTLGNLSIDWDPRPAVCVVMASQGYPGSYKKGKIIQGLAAVSKMKDVTIFHAGTAIKGNSVVTNGGRVLGVTAFGSDYKQAIKRAYEAVGRIKWEDVYSRKDIGRKALKNKGNSPLVGIVMGSDSDLPVMVETTSVLKKMGISYEITIASAHRSPQRTHEYAQKAAERGLEIIIAGAGAAAHLAGVIASETSLPVIGVPINSSALNGLDSLLSTVQMPPGVPVATMAVGKAGARNAAIFAAQILALKYPHIAEELRKHKVNMAQEVEEKASRLGPI
ncbi:MAG: phosphoribosylamine--glycine ligase [Thermodesulfobacteriota bacterium]|nr:phosphoribosylamine--glycine ligase [Thermodesulfobacteriota bacterium]